MKMLDPNKVRRFEQFRGVEPGTPICSAPSLNLHFSQLGVVTACCFNRRQVLGVYPRDSVEDIWQGEPIAELRDALAVNDLSLGCDKCAQQVEAGDFEGNFANWYSNLDRTGAKRREELGYPDLIARQNGPLPMRLEFNIHNACNLECVMCHGLASSSIRSQREKLPPLPNPYDGAFVDQLEPFLPWVLEADFMGGEPFMIGVYRELWERIAKVNPKIKVCILTNGTILDDSIKQLLESFNCWMHVSIDSTVKDTYEAIRRGADYDLVMDNVSYFSGLMKERGYPLIFRYCPMRQNWRELPDTVRYCNDRDIHLAFNQLDSPLNFSLTTLPKVELRAVVDYLRKNTPALESSAAGQNNYGAYVELVNRLEGFLSDETRLSGLMVRLDVADTVVDEYTKHKNTKAARGVEVPVNVEDMDPLVKGTKRFLIARMNIEQGMRTEEEIPKELASKLNDLFRELTELLEKTDEKTFARVFLLELIRAYSGVWGVIQPHDQEIFDRAVEFADKLSELPQGKNVIANLIRQIPGDLYRSLCSRSADELLADWTSHERVA